MSDARANVGHVGGVDTVRGISYQHAHAVLTALDVVGSPDADAVMVEGAEDVIDIAVLSADGKVILAKQIKTRDQAYTWGRAELLAILTRWLSLALAAEATFEFVTDGRLGPTGEAVKTALDTARAEDLEPVALLLGLAETDPACALMARCFIRQDYIGVEPVLAEAEREVRSVQAVVAGDADIRARDSVDRLFTEMSVRAGSSEPAERVLTKTEILELIDGTVAVAPEDRWGVHLRSEYLAAITALPAEELVSPRLERPDDLGELSIADLGAGGKYATLSGGTGSGKSTTARLLRAHGASSDAPVVIVHAEAYLAGRLDSLVADGISALVGRDLPTLTGRQVLFDDTVTVVIDGVAEVPRSVRSSLSDELRPLSSRGHGARLLLIGRDSAALRSVLGLSVAADGLTVANFDDEDRAELASDVLEGSDLDPKVGLAKADHALGDAAGNPMFLTMALQLLAEGINFQDRAGLYSGVIEQMAARTATTEISIVTAVLGVAYAELLNEGRRYASGYEWHRRVTSACELLDGVGVHSDAASVLEAAESCGVVTRVGHTQVRIPVHDSFADYLAGFVHSEGIVALPAVLADGDVQRVLFAGEVGGVTADSASRLASDLPFATIRHSRNDHRSSVPDSAVEVAALLRSLAPGTSNHGVLIWTNGDRIVASLVPDASTGWVEEAEGKQAMGQWPTCIVEPPNGALAIAVRLWALFLDGVMSDSTSWQPRTCLPDASAAAEAVAAHVAETMSATLELIEKTLPASVVPVVRSEMGALGLRALVLPERETAFRDNDFLVIYQQSDEVDVRPATAEEIAAVEAGGDAFDLYDGMGGQTGSDFLLRKTPWATATERVSKVVNRLAGRDWL